LLELANDSFVRRRIFRGREVAGRLVLDDDAAIDGIGPASCDGDVVVSFELDLSTFGKLFERCCGLNLKVHLGLGPGGRGLNLLGQYGSAVADDFIQ